MLKRSLLVTLAAVTLSGQIGAEALARPDAGERCRMLKLSATGAHAREVLRCHVRAIGFAMSVVPACVEGADAKLARTFARVENKAACPPTLAVAQAESAAFVASLLARAQPTPVPTPAPTPSPSPMFTGCGNDVVESGEQCDGQDFCTTACAFELPTVCCGPVGACIQGPFPTMADQCFLAGVQYVLGAVCVPSEPGCLPTEGCQGSCAPESTFPTTSVCCDFPAGCTDEGIGDTIQLWQFAFQGCLLIGGTSQLGTCEPTGNCRPGG